MLLSFKFLIVCTVGVELFINEENLLFQLEWCSQVVFSGVLSGEVLTICVGLQMALIRL